MDGNRTECDNAFADRVQLTRGQAASIAVIVVLSMLLAASVNTILAYAMYKCKLLKSRGNFYLFLLTISDGFYSISTMPLFLLLYTKYSKKRNCSLELASCFMGQGLFNISTYLITLIAFHRSLKIDPSMKNLSYKGLSAMSGRIANFLVVCCFVIPIAHGFISTPFFGRRLFAVANAAIKGVNIAMFLIICGLYVKVYYRFSRRRDMIVKRQDGTGNKQNGMRMHGSPYQAKFMKTVFLILVSLFINVFPYFVMDIWTSYRTYILKTDASSNIKFIYYLTVIALSFNCVCNAVIVMYRNRPVTRFLTERARMIFRLVGNVNRVTTE